MNQQLFFKEEKDKKIEHMFSYYLPSRLNFSEYTVVILRDNNWIDLYLFL